MKDLNLIPKSYFIEKKNKIRKAYLSILILCIGFIAVIAYIAPTAYEYNLKSEKNSLEQRVAETNNFVVLENEFNSLKTAIEAREQEGQLLSQKQLNLLGIVNAIEAASPENLFIQKLDTVGDDGLAVKVALKGVAEDEETIASFIRNLMDDGYFREVVLSSVIYGQGNNGSSFDISLNGVVKSGLTTFNGWDYGFSIGYQADWIIKQENDSEVVFVANKSTTAAEPASTVVSVETTNFIVENFTKERQDKLKDSLKNYKLEYSSKTKSSNKDAIKTMYYADEGNIRYQYLELCVIKDKKGYVITYKSDSTSFSNKARTIDRILKSFNIH